MTTETATPPGAISDNDVANALSALRARLAETQPGAYLTRPLHRRQVAELYRIVLDYQALTQRRKEDQP